jgi:hypothetical protein
MDSRVHNETKKRFGNDCEARFLDVLVPVDGARLINCEIGNVLPKNRVAAPLSKSGLRDAVIRRPATVGWVVNESALSPDDVVNDLIYTH